MPDNPFWVARLNAEDAGVAWPKAAPLLESAIRRGPGLYELDDVRDMVTQPESGTRFGLSLWLIAEMDELLGVWTTNVRVYPRAKVVEIAFAGGREMRRWYDVALAETEKFARENGCSRLHCGGRRGWARLGYTTIGYWNERVL